MFVAWSADDREKALGFTKRQRETCSGCGTHPDEWQADADAYVGWLERCPGCERLEQEENNIPEAKRSSRSIKRFLVPRSVAERMMARGRERR